MRPRTGIYVCGTMALMAVTSPSSAEPPLREHAEDVADYTLRARLDPTAHTVHGEGTIRFRNTSSATLHELWLHLYLNAFKNERSVFMREPAAGFRGSAPVIDWGTIDVRSLSLRDSSGDPALAKDLLPEMDLTGGVGTADVTHDETDARIPLPRDIAPGETLTLDVVWDDKLPGVIERTGYHGSFHFVGQWFPKLARLEPDGTWAHFPCHHLAEFYADFGTYDVTLDVPESYTVGATGPRVESRRDAGRLIERHVQSDVHDFAWTAWDQFESREEPIDGVEVRILYPKGFDADAEAELRAIRFAIPHFRDRYGRYPYSVLTLVHPPPGADEAGGMEYPTLITTGGAWFAPLLSREIELVTIHEFGHQYFYGLLASNEVEWPFLDEGVNSYAEADALGAMFGAGSVVRFAGFSVSDHSLAAVLGDAFEHDSRVAQPAYAFPTGQLYAALVYQRTSAILETMRRVYGDDAMARALGGYTRAFRFEHPGPDAFVQSFADGMGREAAATLRRALFDEGWVDYAVTEVVSHATTPPRGLFDRNGKRETITDAPVDANAVEGSVLVERRGTLSFPVDVELTLVDGKRVRMRWDGRDSSVRLPYQGASRIRAAVVDPDHNVLLDDDLANNHATASDMETAGAPRVRERATYWAELLAEVFGP
jgi:hypothetical protein